MTTPTASQPSSAKPRNADPAPWYKTMPGVEQALTLGLTSRELALWFDLRLKFWAAGCRPLPRAVIDHTARMQGLIDGGPTDVAWVDAILKPERGLEEQSGTWVFVDLVDQHAETIHSRAKSAEAGRKGGQAKSKSPEQAGSSGQAAGGSGDF